MKKKNGFTLIELLAVIIILGILMIIAIPSVTRYISDSRKSAYVDTAKQIISGAKNFVNKGDIEMYSTDTTYYIDSACIKTENANKSPYGEFKKSYILVIYDGKGYNYYWTSVDETGQGIKNIVKYDNLDEDDIESNIKLDDINIDTAIGKRTNLQLIDEDCKKGDEIEAVKKVSMNGGERSDISESCVVQPASVKIYSDQGDIVTEGDHIHLTSELVGFDNCEEIEYLWQFKGALTSNEWDYVDNYSIDWIIENQSGRLTFLANIDSIKYTWRLVVNVD